MSDKQAVFYHPRDRHLSVRGSTPLTREVIAACLRELGIGSGDVVMVHVRMSAFGWIVGGSETVFRALLDSVGPSGTVMAFTGWEDSPYHLALWPKAWRQAYETSMPAFDPAVSEARQDFGRFPERLRTWPGARRSAHPDVSVAAFGAAAEWLIVPHSAEDPWGRTSPFGRFVEAGGKVLLLGAPLSTLTICHHAEAIVEIPGKRFMEYRMPILSEGKAQWRPYRAIDTFYNVFPYEARYGSAGQAREQIAAIALEKGYGRSIEIGSGRCHLLDARKLVLLACEWLKAAFGLSSPVDPE